MSKDSIALIGFMGTGKTTVAKGLVKLLGSEYNLIETDELIIQEVGKSIPEIFEEEGEAKFREYEISVCDKVSKLNKVVISCGGGIVLNPVNIDNLRRNCHIILLTASIEEIYKRIMKNGEKFRPLIKKEEPLEEIKKILAYRQPLYESSADIIVDTSGKLISKIVTMILFELKKLD
ncbi:MAG: shikimate kinase [Promethearchaeota archaeon]